MRGALLLDDVMYIINRTRNDVEMKKRELKEQTKGILAGQTVLGEMRKKLRDSQSQVDQLLESKKAVIIVLTTPVYQHWLCCDLLFLITLTPLLILGPHSAITYETFHL